MAQKAYIINSSTAEYNDDELQQLQTLLFGEGVFGDPSTGTLGLQVTERTSPDMNVEISTGKALIEVTVSGRTFKVVVENTATETVAIASNVSGSNRVDAIIVRVDVDTEPNALKTNIATIERVAGTGASALSDGAITTAVGSDGWYRLADVTVPNGTSDIENGDITDTRSKVTTTSAITVEDSNNPALTADDTTVGDTEQEQTTSSSTVAVGETDAASNNVKLAQSFQPAKSKIRGVRLFKKTDTGTFTGTVTVSLQADAAGAPSGSALATVTLTNANWLDIDDDTEFEVTFTSEYASLSVGTTYWIVVETSTTDSANHPNIGAGGGNPYANGDLYNQNTADGWSSIVSTDLYFKTIEGIENQVVKTQDSGIIISDVLPVGLLFTDFVAGASTSVDTNWIDYMDVTLSGVFTANTGIRVKAHISATMGNQADEYTQYRVLLNGTAVATISLGNSPYADEDVNTQGHIDWLILNNNSLSAQKYLAEIFSMQDSLAVDSSSASAGTLRTYARGTTTIDTSNRVRVQLQGRVTQPDANLNHQFLGGLIEKIG